MENIGNLGDLGNLGITITGRDVSPNIIRSSYGDTVSEISQNKKYEKGSLVKWVSRDNKEIVWMVIEK